MAVHPKSWLPPQELRAGGSHFSADDDYIASGERDARRLQEFASLDAHSRVLDWGCGTGRLATGLKSAGVTVRSYLGVDVRRDVITWANDNLRDDVYRFVQVSTRNARYNSEGAGHCWLPAPTASIHVLYAYSVISHLLDDDTNQYLIEIRRVLTPMGRAFVTAFIEEGVPNVSENPEGYGPITWQGSLHCVRYDRQFLVSLVERAGLRVVHLDHGAETDGQSLMVLARAETPTTEAPQVNPWASDVHSPP